mmetsp:Transcript_9976/g.20789  ORF Transcript_9976/g.20789 Transcript_9976/m.20789 type:complete len:122 (+) Transcript_9976:145-510(+)|eukprot:CAMPEP_0197279842 /NCGR_PEP_ID=MMETSP1432-20130617/20653_1 /TAXON_ID=44447 /ORGANISM="Pseudo-nitzschia delicatissima, Strain UNC1205" /LENGTH=121 /DNA_ID=CAMNT_0042746441 /DNA_START=139 /DNA_END=504 /DNA_ORIENTATION=-
MKMILSSRSIKPSGVPMINENGIECKILGRQQKKLLVGVLVPTDPQPKTTTNRSILVHPPSALLESFEEQSRNVGRLMESKTDDETFRRELEEKDAAFLKRVHDRDTAFRAKIATKNSLNN